MVDSQSYKHDITTYFCLKSLTSNNISRRFRILFIVACLIMVGLLGIDVLGLIRKS